MQAICTKYLGPTNTKGGRVKAYTASGLNATTPWDSRSVLGNHLRAVEALVDRYDSLPDVEHWYPGAIKGGYAWVYVPNHVATDSQRKHKGIRHVHAHYTPRQAPLRALRPD